MIRLKATIFLCIRSLAQMELFAPCLPSVIDAIFGSDMLIL